MKLCDVYVTEQQLDEASLKKAIAAGMMAGAMLAPAKNLQSDNVNLNQHQVRTTITQKADREPTDKQFAQKRAKQIDKQFDENQAKQLELARKIATDYRINPNLAAQIVEIAHKYEKPVFPKAEDILAIAAVESSFNPNAVSKLKRDPAIGLMQVRPGVWNINKEELSNIENQIMYGAEILYLYFKKLKSKEAAIEAYNVGITNYRRGIGNPNYLSKYENRLAWVQS